MPAGTTAGEINQYLYVTLATPVTLTAGTYTVDGYITNLNDIYQYNVATITAATGVTYGAPRLGGGNAYPATNGFDENRATSDRTSSSSCPSRPPGRC